MCVARTCYIKLYLQCDFIGESSVPQQLIGLLQRPVLCGDPVYGQEPVPDLEKTTSVTGIQITSPPICNYLLDKQLTD